MHACMQDHDVDNDINMYCVGGVLGCGVCGCVGVSLWVCVCTGACVYVQERERERERTLIGVVSRYS